MQNKRVIRPILKAASALLMTSVFLGPSFYSVTAGEFHTVEQGETLYHIAEKYGITVESLMALNGLNSSYIDRGQQLIIEGNHSDDGGYTYDEGVDYESTSTYIVQPGDYLAKIASHFGMTVSQLKSLNGLSSDFIDVGDLIAVTSDGTTSVTPAPYGSSGSGYYWNDDYSSYGESGTYKVQPGDNVWDIAMAYGLTQEQLMAYNGLASKWIYPGDLLYIPGSGSSVPQGYIPYTPVYQEPAYTYTDSFAYTVQAGDNVWDIAVANGLTEEYLMAYNGMTSKLVYPGEVLYIPTTSTATPAPTPAPAPVETAPTESSIPTTPVPSSETVSETEPVESETRTVRPPAQTRTVGSRELADPETPAIESTDIDLETHEVAEGDDLASIASTYDITGAQIREWNQLLNDEIQEGDILYVTDPTNAVTATKQLRPLSEVYPLEYLPSRGEDLEDVFKMFNVTEENILTWNDLNSTEEFAAGLPLVVTHPSINPAIYEVQEGDSIASVSEATGISVETIRSWNGLLDNIIYIGEELAVSNPYPTLHEVQPGESLEDIASQYNVSIDDLRNWNNLPEQSLFVNGTLIVSDPTAEVEMEEDTTQPAESGTSETDNENETTVETETTEAASETEDSAE